MSLVQSLEEVQKWIDEVLKDPITELLLINSNITKIQLETLLINISSENIVQNKIRMEEQALFRIKGKISRGSFNRTLKQARKNILNSIYTVLLLGYIGIFDTSVFVQYIELSNKLRSYLETYREKWSMKETLDEEDYRIIDLIKNELMKDLNEYSSPRKLSSHM